MIFLFFFLEDLPTFENNLPFGISEFPSNIINLSIWNFRSRILAIKNFFFVQSFFLFGKRNIYLVGFTDVSCDWWLINISLACFLHSIYILFYPIFLTSKNLYFWTWPIFLTSKVTGHPAYKYLSRDLRKPVFRLSIQVQHKPTCTVTEEG